MVSPSEVAVHYGLAHLIHLFCAILFIGVVFFEVVLLEGVRPALPADTMASFESALVGRAKRLMPFVVGALFVSGVAMAYVHRASLAGLASSSFGAMLALKIALALSVLVHFVTALRAGAKGCMSSTRFKRTHLSVALHMVAIVVLAKLMFYVRW